MDPINCIKEQCFAIAEETRSLLDAGTDEATIRERIQEKFQSIIPYLQHHFKANTLKKIDVAKLVQNGLQELTIAFGVDASVYLCNPTDREEASTSHSVTEISFSQMEELELIVSHCLSTDEGVAEYFDKLEQEIRAESIDTKVLNRLQTLRKELYIKLQKPLT